MTDKQIYVAVCHDRHTDDDIKVFTTADAAIAYAKKFCEEGTDDPSSIDEHKVEGWLYSAYYNSESDGAYVFETKLQT